MAGHRSFGPPLHGSQGPELVGAQRPAPHPTRRLCCELNAQLALAGGRPGFEQGLELPGLRPPVPVGDIRGEAADKRAGATLGAQPEVDTPGLAGQRDELLRVAPADQDNVDVAAVVELACTELAHVYDRQLLLQAAGPGSSVEDPVSQIRQQRPDCLQWDLLREVEGGDPEDFERLPAR